MRRVEPGDLRGRRHLAHRTAADADAAAAAERGGAEGVVLHLNIPEFRDATGLPILWRVDASPPRRSTGPDARSDRCRVLEDDAEHVERRWNEAHDDRPRVRRRGARLRRARARHGAARPGDLLLSPQEAGNDEDPLDNVLDLLADVRPGSSRSPTSRSRRRTRSQSSSAPGVDAVIVASQNLAGLVRAAPPEV
jgi:hypothetical protein